MASTLKLNDKGSQHQSSVGSLIKQNIIKSTYCYNMLVVSSYYDTQSCIGENIILFFLVNTEPVHSGRDGADEPPTLIKEDLLSSGTVRRSTPDTQVNLLKIDSKKGQK